MGFRAWGRVLLKVLINGGGGGAFKNNHTSLTVDPSKKGAYLMTISATGISNKHDRVWSFEFVHGSEGGSYVGAGGMI